jgi:thymidylate synthase
MKTNDILNLFKEKYKNNDIRTIGNDVQQSNTLEIQNAHFEVDKPWIVREPNYEYFKNELTWYESESLNVNDIPGGAPVMWKTCADPLGYINSNYGWCIFSQDNGYQYENCKNKLIEDPHTREAIMIYNRPSMQTDYNKNGMHDFMCCQNMQYFINKRDDKVFLDCIVNFRSCDAVFGFNNDALWAKYVQEKLANDLNNETTKFDPEIIFAGKLYWNAGSLHIYERHFKYLK